jgi:hypothetical protein
MTTLWAVYQQGHLKYTGKNLCLNGRSRYNIVDMHKMKIPIRSNGKLTEHGYRDVRDKSELAHFVYTHVQSLSKYTGFQTKTR